jgi:hypothetical protein
MTNKVASQIIGLDMDGVILDNTASKIRVAGELGFKISPAEAQSDVIEGVLPREVIDVLRERIYGDTALHLASPLVKGAHQGLAKIRSLGLECFLISRRRNPAIARAALIKNRLWPDYFNESNSFFVEHAEDKNIKAKELNIGAYLDDQPSVLEKLNDVPNRFLMDRFDNFGGFTFDHVRVDSWDNFLSHIL